MPFRSLLLLAATLASAAELYQKPPKEVLDVLNAPATPRAFVSPDRTRVLLAEPLRYPSIADLSQPMLRLAGLRINPKTNGPHRGVSYTGMVLKNVGDGAEVRIAGSGLGKLGAPQWSPDGKHLAAGQNQTEVR